MPTIEIVIRETYSPPNPCLAYLHMYWYPRVALAYPLQPMFCITL